MRSGRDRLLQLLVIALVVSLVALPSFLGSAEGAGLVWQPGRAEQGFGSSAGYISASATRFEAGAAERGTQVYWYIPSVLRDGDSAPIVVFLHGFSALTPELYQGHIDHLTKQGYIVIFPQFQKTGAAFLGDTDQNEMLRRAVASTGLALRRIGTQGEREHLYLYGHSLGGLMAATWVSAGGPRPDGHRSGPSFSRWRCARLGASAVSNQGDKPRSCRIHTVSRGDPHWGR